MTFLYKFYVNMASELSKFFRHISLNQVRIMFETTIDPFTLFYWCVVESSPDFPQKSSANIENLRLFCYF